MLTARCEDAFDNSVAVVDFPVEIVAMDYNKGAINCVRGQYQHPKDR